MNFMWQFHSKKNKSPTWYLWAIVTALAVIIYGIIINHIMLSVVVFLFVGVYILIDNNSNDIMNVVIGEEGIHVGASHFHYSKLASFSILYNGEFPHSLRLNMSGYNYGVKQVSIPFGNFTQINELRAFLLEHAKENQAQNLGFIDRMVEKTGL